MINVEAADLTALYCLYIVFVHLSYISKDKIHKIPFFVIQYSSTAPEIAACKITIQLKYFKVLH